MTEPEHELPPTEGDGSHGETTDGAAGETGALAAASNNATDVDQADPLGPLNAVTEDGD